MICTWQSHALAGTAKFTGVDGCGANPGIALPPNCAQKTWRVVGAVNLIQIKRAHCL
jgi:hypothetical protein